MSTLFENYITGDTGDSPYGAIAAGARKAQTFTPLVSHTVSSVKLKLFRYGSPGTVTVYIFNTSAGLPTSFVTEGAFGTYAGNSLTTDSEGEWITFILSVPWALVAGTMYAIVASCAATYLYWRLDRVSPSYSRGTFCEEVTPNAWVPDDEGVAADFMFEEWGTWSEGVIYPVDPICRVTGLIHRYNRAAGEYTLEMNLGEVTSDFGLPQPDLGYVSALPNLKGGKAEMKAPPIIQPAKGPPTVESLLAGTAFKPELPTAAQLGVGLTEYSKMIQQKQVMEALNKIPGGVKTPADIQKLISMLPPTHPLVVASKVPFMTAMEETMQKLATYKAPETKKKWWEFWK